MKIKLIKIKKFKRFTDLTISDIPESAKLILLVGPNGSGKTSLFEAFNHWYKLKGFNSAGQRDYYEKIDDTPTSQNWHIDKVSIDFHDPVATDRDAIKGKFYFRTAYRNEPDFTVSNLNSRSLRLSKDVHY